MFNKKVSQNIYSGQNLTFVRIMICIQWQEHEKAIRVPIPNSRPRLNRRQLSTITLNPYCLLKTSLTPESKIIQPIRADPTSYRMPPLRGDFIHHHGQIEVNFFESRKLFCVSIIFLVKSYHTTQQAVKNSDVLPLQRANPNLLDMVLVVRRICRFKPNS